MIPAKICMYSSIASKVQINLISINWFGLKSLYAVMICNATLLSKSGCDASYTCTSYLYCSTETYHYHYQVVFDQKTIRPLQIPMRKAYPLHESVLRFYNKRFLPKPLRSGRGFETNFLDLKGFIVAFYALVDQFIPGVAEKNAISKQTFFLGHYVPKRFG